MLATVFKSSQALPMSSGRATSACLADASAEGRTVWHALKRLRSFSAE